MAEAKFKLKFQCSEMKFWCWIFYRVYFDTSLFETVNISNFFKICTYAPCIPKPSTLSPQHAYKWWNSHSPWFRRKKNIDSWDNLPLESLRLAIEIRFTLADLCSAIVFSPQQPGKTNAGTQSSSNFCALTSKLKIRLKEKSSQKLNPGMMRTHFF